VKIQVSKEIAGRTMTLTTGEIAKQSSGTVFVQHGETVVMVASQAGPPRAGIDFFPLTVEYRERLAASGRFPGGFIKREGRPSVHEILTCRLTDRPLRPLFPDWYRGEIQIISLAMACDGENLPDVLSIIGASAALSIAPVPFRGPIGAVRVGMIDDQFIAFPTHQQIETSKLDLVVAGNRDSVLMIEGFGKQIPDDVMVDAIAFGHEVIRDICGMIEELKAKVVPNPPVFEEPAKNPMIEVIRGESFQKFRAAKLTSGKHDRSAAVDAVKTELRGKYFPEGVDATPEGYTKAQLEGAMSAMIEQAVRDIILGGTRLDGRNVDQIRAVSCAVDVLPRVHGSALFTRGETQSLATVVLGTSRDKQIVEDLFGEHSKRFSLDYNFPSYSVGEVKPIRGPGRREIGHGALAERSVASVIPDDTKFPYTIRVISDITESNGSSSMASVCNATISLMDAGVPITQPVAGISIGLIKEPDRHILLTDIMGDEDHYGDMDFKVAGTQKGITGIQLDLKIDGISLDIIRETLKQAYTARIDLLRTMLTSIRRPRADISKYAPRLIATKIDPEKIGLLIGPGGKNIRAIQESTGTVIDIKDDGTVTISAPSLEKVNAALASVEAIAEDIKVGRIYEGKVTSIKDFGAFIEIAPGKDGLCHISELSDDYVRNVHDVCKVGDRLRVKVIAVDDQNRVKLSRKVLLKEENPNSGDDENGDGEEE
jgi:polyribonucleotide nucleotidyltransferase